MNQNENQSKKQSWNQSKRWALPTACALVGCLLLSGCMNAGARVDPNAAGSVQPQVSVWPGAQASNTPEMSAPEGTNVFDWMTGGSAVEEKINMLSEIQQSRVVVSGETALVGVTFANQYKGEMTQRIHDMVAGEVQAADASVKAVAVTAEKEDVEKINAIADRLAAGTPVNELEGEIDTIIRNVTTIQ